HISKMEEIVSEVDAWQQHRNNKNGKNNWQFTTSDERQKLKRL
ncbi:MAG: IS630 family transposase, partial [Edaphocola sp.]